MVESAAEIRAWLIDWTARRIGRRPETGDAALPLEAFGLDSLSAATLAGELEDWLGCRLPAPSQSSRRRFRLTPLLPAPSQNGTRRTEMSCATQ